FDQPNKKTGCMIFIQPVLYYSLNKSCCESDISYKNGAITRATTDINFNNMLREGPEVSLNGSPTVSPTTVALCISDPFLRRTPSLSTPSSTIFLALSHAPPAVDWQSAIITPVPVTPAIHG